MSPGLQLHESMKPPAATPKPMAVARISPPTATPSLAKGPADFAEGPGAGLAGAAFSLASWLAFNAKLLPGMGAPQFWHLVSVTVCSQLQRATLPLSRNQSWNPQFGQVRWLRSLHEGQVANTMFPDGAADPAIVASGLAPKKKGGIVGLAKRPALRKSRSGVTRPDNGGERRALCGGRQMEIELRVSDELTLLESQRLDPTLSKWKSSRTYGAPSTRM